MIEWNEKYSTGINVIDEQHQELFKMANELQDSIDSDMEMDRPYMIARLEVYSLYHFTSEEHLMAKCGYNEIDRHLGEHKKFRRKVLKLKKQFIEEEGKETANEFLTFILEWLKHHIMEIDHKYVDCMSKLKLQ